MGVAVKGLFKNITENHYLTRTTCFYFFLVFEYEGKEMPAEMKAFLNPTFVEPPVPFQRMCCRNMIRHVENYESGNFDRELAKKAMICYHTIPRTPPFKLYMCTTLQDYRHIKHELFDITVSTCVAYSLYRVSIRLEKEYFESYLHRF